MRSKKSLAVVSVTIPSAERGVLLQNWLSTNLNSSITTKSRDFPEKHLDQIESARRQLSRNRGLCSPVLFARFPWRWAHSTSNNFLTCQNYSSEMRLPFPHLAFIQHTLLKALRCAESWAWSRTKAVTEWLPTMHPTFLSIWCYTNTLNPWGNLWGRHCFRTHFADAD